MQKRERLGSRLGFILVSAGCAVGLGNVWKFPYMCGQYGGAAFILIYLVFLAILGFPIMVCEFSVGRGSQRSCASSFRVLEPAGTHWHRYGPVCMVGNYLLMMFYTMVCGWMLYYCIRALRGDFTGTVTVDDTTAAFGAMTASAPTMIFWTVVTVLIAFAICSLGVQGGVERVTKVMMVCLLLLIIVLAVNSLRLPGAEEGVRFYLVPDFAAMKEQGIGKVVFGAMSQSFFTLSIGIGSMAIFGSYLDKDHSLAGETVSITLLDTFVAIMAGLIIIPACFAYGIEPGSGPGLVFITLPNIFSEMPGGHLWGTLFFLFLSFAALSTVVAVFENILSCAMDLWGCSRKKAVAVNIVLVILLSAPCVLGFNVLSGVQPMGEGTAIMDLEDFLVSNNVLPLGSIIYLTFCVSRNGWGWDNFLKEANSGKGMKFPVILKNYMRYILPLIVLVIYLKGYWDTFADKGASVRIVWTCVEAVCLLFTAWLVFGRKKQKAQQD